MSNRQLYPIGDTVFGQYVQTNKPLSIQNVQPSWTNFLTTTVSSSVITLDKSWGYNYAFITVESNSIRFTIDGSVPTSTLGHLLVPGDILELESIDEIQGFQAICVSTDATIICTFGAV